MKTARDEMDYELTEAIKHINNALSKYVTTEHERHLLTEAIEKITKANGDDSNYLFMELIKSDIRKLALK